jgi:uncharacterized membrane protein
MESRLKLLGHPIHPMLIVFPLGLLSVTVLFDALSLATGTVEFGRFGFYAMTVGIIGGLAAAIFGFWDWLGIRGGTRAKRIGAWHGIGNLAIVLLFAASWVIRVNDPSNAPTGATLVIELVAIAMALVTAWLGGELVYRHRVGVDEIASLDAPSSLAAGGAARQTADQRDRTVRRA